MAVPMPPQALVNLAGFVRDRLADVNLTLSPAGHARAIAPLSASRELAARQFSTAIIGAAAPFAATSYARVRLLRQLHATGLLSAAEVDRSFALLAAPTAAPC